ncbi:hypothetical protein [Flavicella marina]|uniref:hypothetical protein n=1 Tax=Flavicella marina TaxID=1475951 RepID=UPI001263EAF2|nr:hypothetical protein [Flavicella marina]
MKSIKTILVIAVILLSLTNVTAQKKTLEDKANEKIVQIDKFIISENENLGLEEEQKEKMLAYQVGMLKEVKEIKSQGLSEEETKVKLKALYKKAYKEMIVGVLSKEQQIALKTAKKKSKNS